MLSEANVCVLGKQQGYCDTTSVLAQPYQVCLVSPKDVALLAEAAYVRLNVNFKSLGTSRFPQERSDPNSKATGGFFLLLSNLGPSAKICSEISQGHNCHHKQTS